MAADLHEVTLGFFPRHDSEECVSGRYLVIVGVVVAVLLLQQLPLPPLLLQGLLNERRHLALLTRALSANHKPAITSGV